MKYIIPILLMITTLIGCSEDNIVTKEKTPIVFGVSVTGTFKSTACPKDVFSNGDKIGVFGFRKSGDDMIPFMENAEFLYQSESFTSLNENAFWEINTPHNFFAYYPVDQNVTVTPGSSPTAMVTVGKEGVPVDFMWSSLTNLTYSSIIPKASFTFNHKLSRVRFLLKVKADLPSATLTKIEFAVDRNIGICNLTTGNLTTSGSFQMITLSGINQVITTDEKPVKEGEKEWNPIILPGSEITLVRIILDGKEYFAKDIYSTTFKEGGMSTITLTF